MHHEDLLEGLLDFFDLKADLTRSTDFMRACISRSLRSLISRKRCCNRFLRVAGVSLGKSLGGTFCFILDVP